ncbi:uncharacterized protein LOC119337272 [Triticum dicoccoides]|uniref:uncharacterized protein LOC119337272 n=1 Tax=Triticum dicoccoides TaxID=85692 RepID=UPI001891CF27|nr:uncharacterized protein LOC119337272 [Triticum dicoccoides]
MVFFFTNSATPENYSCLRHCPPPHLSFLPPLPASRALSLSRLRSPQVSARLRVSGQQQQLRQFGARRSRALGDVEEDDLPLPHSGVLLCAVERRPWPPDARAPPAKDAPASRPPPRHPHLVGDLHQVPSSARTTLRARPAALQPERFGRLAPEAEERSSLPRASPARTNQQADPASFSLPSPFLFFRRDASSLPSLLRRGSRQQAAACARRWRRQMEKRWWCPAAKQFN